MNRDGFNGFDGETEATFGSTLISVSKLIDFLMCKNELKSAVQFSAKYVKFFPFLMCKNEVKSPVQFSVKYVKYINTKLRRLCRLVLTFSRLPHVQQLGEICRAIFRKIRKLLCLSISSLQSESLLPHLCRLPHAQEQGSKKGGGPKEIIVLEYWLIS